jgi:peptidoglycan/LPS O-acetylase OafA/YrhL
MTKASRLGQPGVLSVLAGVLGGLVVVAYVAVVTSQGESPWGQVVTWALAMTVPAVLAFASLRLPQRTARWAAGRCRCTVRRVRRRHEPRGWD